ncbi:MAG: hypothetical protein JWQ04_2849 [Pedosphaera sp.]|nr:hypothetical protein [Pedosphaera sp.]
MDNGKNAGKPASKFAAFQTKEHKCPKCGSVIYSRRNVLCGACGERIPTELLFTPEERQMVEKELKDAKLRAREASAIRPISADTDSSCGSDIGGL